MYTLPQYLKTDKNYTQKGVCQLIHHYIKEYYSEIENASYVVSEIFDIIVNFQSKKNERKIGSYRNEETGKQNEFWRGKNLTTS